MARELSAKERKTKEKIEKSLANFDLTWETRGRRYFALLPSDPRCASCLAPFEGYGGSAVRILLNRRRSTINPLMCNVCEDAVRRLRFGAEVEMSMLFADIRDSTPLADSMRPIEFKQLIERFYSETAHVLVHTMAMIDKLAGDAVSGYYLPSVAGKEYSKIAIGAAEEMLRVTGHAEPDGPWVWRSIQA